MIKKVRDIAIVTLLPVMVIMGACSSKPDVKNTEVVQDESAVELRVKKKEMAEKTQTAKEDALKELIEAYPNYELHVEAVSVIQPDGSLLDVVKKTYVFKVSESHRTYVVVINGSGVIFKSCV